MARAEQLAGDLEAAEKRAEAAETEVEELRAKLRMQQRDLDRLKAKLGEPREAPQRDGPARGRMPLLAGAAAACFVVAGVTGWLLMRASPETPELAAVVVKAPKKAAPVLRAEGRTTFVTFLHHVRANCKVGSGGWLGKCKPASLPKELKTAEERVGAQAAAMSYCKLLDSGDRKLARLAAFMLSRFRSRRLKALDREVFRCLDGAVRRRGRGAYRVVEVWASLGARLGQERAVLAFLQDVPLTWQRRGYKGLWTFGRLRLWPVFRSMLASPDVIQVDMALRSMSYLRGDEERKVICPALLQTVRKHVKNQFIAARGTYELGLSCRKRHAADVLSFAEEGLRRAGSSVDYWWLAAVGVVARRYAEPAPKVRARAIALVKSALHDTKLNPLRRNQALRVLAEIDVELAKREAKSLPAGAGSAFQRTIERLRRK